VFGGWAAGLLGCWAAAVWLVRHGCMAAWESGAWHGTRRAIRAGRQDMDLDMVIWGRVANKPATGRKRRACGHDIRYARGIRMRVRR
jgi:hypothetical protein